jgi:hypothetical protein
MISKTYLIIVGTALLFPGSALAQGSNFFAGLDVSGAWASGSSNTTNGGADFAGGGVVGNVKFDNTVGIGGHVGYRFDSALSTFISYQHVRGDVSWDANFPLLGVSSGFDGNATSHLILGNLAYDWALSDATSIRTSVGLGLSLNSLSGVVETDIGTGLFLSDVTDHTRKSAAAQIGFGIQHRIASNIALGLNAAVSYTGGFGTGDTRSGNLGITSITPYQIDDVWRTSLGTSIEFEF